MLPENTISKKGLHNNDDIITIFGKKIDLNSVIKIGDGIKANMAR